MNGLTCIHCAKGLCSKCEIEFLDDPLSYLEFGDHPEGIRRWEEVEKLMLSEPVPQVIVYADNDIPF